MFVCRHTGKMLNIYKCCLFFNVQIKKQLPIHILAVKPTQTAFTGLQLVLKSSPDQVRLKPDGDGKIALFLALEAGTNAMAKEMLLILGKEQLAAKCPPNDDTVLHLLIRKRDYEMFKLLFDCGSDINAVNVGFF